MFDSVQIAQPQDPIVDLSRTLSLNARELGATQASPLRSDTQERTIMIGILVAVALVFAIIYLAQRT